jgi:hypothetical protein
MYDKGFGCTTKFSIAMSGETKKEDRNPRRSKEYGWRWITYAGVQSSESKAQRIEMRA